MCKISINEELNGIELSFEQKPDSATIQAIKEQGFRWHHKKMMWYAKQTPDRLVFAESLGTIPTTKKQDKQTQAELKEKYMSIICSEVWKKDARMQDYARKETEYIVPLANGDITDIDRPRIETHFCFGYGQNGISTQEDMDSAYSAMRNADTNESYFIRENLKDLESMIESLKDKDAYWFKFLHYNGQESGSKLKAIRCCNLCDTPEYNPSRWSSCKDLEPLTQEEKDALIEGYEEVKKRFVKRLNTYLKRYGLSKLHTWTYLVD